MAIVNGGPGDSSVPLSLVGPRLVGRFDAGYLGVEGVDQAAQLAIAPTDGFCVPDPTTRESGGDSEV